MMHVPCGKISYHTYRNNYTVIRYVVKLRVVNQLHVSAIIRGGGRGHSTKKSTLMASYDMI
jgi:hypothetical protein